MNQFSVGLTLELGPKCTLVFGLNTPVTVAPPKNHTVRIAPNVDAKVLGNGKIKFAGKGSFVAMITVDSAFSEVRVTIPSYADFMAAIASSSTEGVDINRFMEIIKAIPDDSELGKVLLGIFSVDHDLLKAWFADLRAKLAGINWEAALQDASTLRGRLESELPTPAVEE